MNEFWTTAIGVVAVTGLSAQTPTPSQGSSRGAQEQPSFRVQIDLVTNDVVVRDEKGNFISDLNKDEFQIYEDGIRQDLASMTVVTGGRVFNRLEAPPAPPPEGIILPTKRVTNEVSGRIFVFFVDDLHLQFDHTPRIRDLFKKISKELVHEGDMFGIVSSGPSSLSIDMTYDRTRLDEAIKKMTGSELKPTEIINGSSGAQGPSEVRYRAHVAFSTIGELLRNLETVHNRRKALIYVSDGYDFIPFQDARLGLMDPRSPFAQNESLRVRNEAMNSDTSTQGWSRPNDPNITGSEAFADADLSRELFDVTRAANRANTTIYTLDPRGLVGMGDIGEQVDPKQWSDFIRKSQDSLRVLAEETGGIAVVNQNDFSKALKRIDAETSDYYVLGYYSKNPDPTKRRRQIEVKATRPGLSVWSRKEYVLRPPPAPVSSAKP